MNLGIRCNGKKVFSELGCSRCHGLDGKQGELMTIDLSKYQKAANPMDIVAGIWNHGREIEKAMREKGFPGHDLKKGRWPISSNLSGLLRRDHNVTSRPPP